MIQTSGVQFDVGGVLLPRPFKVRRLGHFGYYMNDLDAAAAFYTQLLGFRITDAPTMQQLLPPHLQHIAAGVLDPRMFFTSNGSDHHVLLFMHSSLAATSPFPTPPQMTTNQLTWQVGTLEEVVDAYHFLKKAGVPIVRAGRDMPDQRQRQQQPGDEHERPGLPESGQRTELLQVLGQRHLPV